MNKRQFSDWLGQATAQFHSGLVLPHELLLAGLSREIELPDEPKPEPGTVDELTGLVIEAPSEPEPDLRLEAYRQMRGILDHVIQRRVDAAAGVDAEYKVEP